MNQKEKIKKYRESIQVEASEEKIQETICKSKIPQSGFTVNREKEGGAD